MMRSRAEAAALGRAVRDCNDNQPPRAGIYPDYSAPVIVRGEDGQRELRDLRWGLPSSQKALLDAAGRRADKLRAKGQVIDDAAFSELLRVEPDKGVTNVRNTASSHWKRWLGPANRCLVPMTSFSEPDQVGGTLKPVWFALDDTRPLTFFAGIHVPGWSCVRKVKDGVETCDLYGFLTTEAAQPVATFHSKAQPVILTTEAERELWMSDAPWAEVAGLQRPLPDGGLRIVAQGARQDEAIPG